MALGRPLGAKLFLEGKEVPFLGTTITTTVNQASIAYVDLVPQQYINDIKPRTHVAIAVRDYNDGVHGYPYVLAWEGEVFGYQFGKSTGSRSFSISCIDTTSYWDNALCFFVNAQLTLAANGFDILRQGLNYTTAVTAGFKVIASNDGPSTNFFKQVMDDTFKGNTSATFLDAFVEVVKKLTDVNDFYNFSEKRLRIQDRILLNSQPLLNELISHAQGADWFNGLVGKLGGFTSVRNVMQDLLSIIFHDFVPVPFPARVFKSNLTGAKLGGLVSTDTTTVGSYVFKPNLYMIPPPLCNVFFPDEYSQFQFSRNFFQEPTRLIYRPEMPFFQSADQVALPYQFEPDSFERFMFGAADMSQFINSSDTGINGDQGRYMEAISPGSPHINYLSSTAYVREAQFLTNEERVKGIWMAQEGMMPATTQFNTADATFKANFSKKVAHYLFYKKRFESRQLQITSHLKLSVVPGFNVLILDDSDAQQNVVAYCSSVTHRIYATEGGYTNVTLSYARTPDEEAQSSTNGSEPPIPPWFDPAVFGSQGTATSKAAPAPLKEAGTVLISTSALSDFYKTLIGGKGYKAVTDYSKGEPTLIGAVAALLDEYRAQRSNGAEDLQAYISGITGRDYVRILDSMGFLGATIPPKTVLAPDTLVEFKGGAFDPNDATNGKVTAFRQVPITKYRDALMQFRGFRG